MLVIAYLGFISLGLPDTLIGVAWPSVRDSFGLQQGTIAWVFFGAGCSYFLSSFFTGRLLAWLGIGLLLAGSSALVALSGFGYAAAPVWMAFAACSVLHGLGSGAIDAGLNHYVAHHFSARHMSWLHACYTLGATFGPLIMTGVIAWHGAWRMGYTTVATMLLVLAVLFAVTHRKWNDGDAKDETAGATAPSAAASVSMMDAWRHPVVRWQVLLFFVYTGLEMTAGQWSFTLLTEARGVSRETAGLWVTTFWGSIFAGRVLFGFVSEKLGIDRLLRGSMLAAVAGTALLAWNPVTSLSVVALAVTGLGLASIYPCLMTRTPQRIGVAMAAHAIGFQVSAAILGGAVLPSAAGFFAQWAGLEIVAVAALGMAVVVLAVHEVLLRRDAMSAPRGASS